MHASSIFTNMGIITAVINRAIIDNIIGNKRMALLADVLAERV
jgi:hypothetical protein